MSGLNEPLGMPRGSHPLTEMPPMEALYAAFAGESRDLHHELTLDPAAMNIHDNDPVSKSAISILILCLKSHQGMDLCMSGTYSWLFTADLWWR